MVRGYCIPGDSPCSLRTDQASNMADVRELENSRSLYNLCVHVITVNFKIFRKDVRYLPASILCDIYYKLFEENNLSILIEEFSNLNVFIKILKIVIYHVTLHKCFQTLEEHGAELGTKLSTEYKLKAKACYSNPCTKSRLEVIDAGLRLARVLLPASKYLMLRTHSELFGFTQVFVGENILQVSPMPKVCRHHHWTRPVALNPKKIEMSRKRAIRKSLKELMSGFLSDAAWYDKAEAVLLACQEVCGKLELTPPHQRLMLHCCQKLLRVQSLYCNLKGAHSTYENTLALINDLKNTDCSPNLAGVYSDISGYFFIRSEYDNSFRYSLLALNELKPSLPAKVMVDVLCQASKTFVVKREFAKAGILGRQAVDLASKVFGVHHPIYADAQLNYGFFLLNFDSIQPCVEVYKSAYSIRSSVFKKNNIHVAVALEDLAYALYVREYISGRFDEAKEKADEAIRIKEKLLPHDHIMHLAAKKVKALILEEIAIDNSEVQSQQKLLADAEAYHLKALNITRKVYGERNLQTAKYYGNLGRVCQSMKKYKESEKMQIKAISVKEELLGPDHLEVGLSIGHLASLYNYHMGEYHKARDLYLRSISIGTKIFGRSYSGLEYDYRGLVHVYTNLNDPVKAAEYNDLLNSWRVLRELDMESNLHKSVINQPPKPIVQTVREILSPNHVQP